MNIWARSGTVRQGMVWHGQARSGGARLGLDKHGEERAATHSSQGNSVGRELVKV